MPPSVGGERVDERVVVLGLVGLAHHRAVVGDRQDVRLVVGEHLALVLVGAAVVLAVPGDRAADLPGRLDPRALHVRPRSARGRSAPPTPARGWRRRRSARWLRSRPCVSSPRICMTHSYNSRMSASANPRLRQPAGLPGAQPARRRPGRAGARVGAGRQRRGGAAGAGGVPRRRPRRPAGRRAGADPLRRRPAGRPARAGGAGRAAAGCGPPPVEVRLTAAGRRGAGAARAARDAVVQETTGGPRRGRGRDARGAAGAARRRPGRGPGRATASRGRRARGGAAPATSSACGRPEGRCPAQVTAAAARSIGWPRGHPDHAEHPQRRLRAARRGGRADRERRLGARRRDGQPLRAQPDLRADDGRGAQPAAPTYPSTRT